MTGATDKSDDPRNWSGTSTVILLAFVVIWTLQADAHHGTDAVACFALAVIYPPLRVLRAQLAALIRQYQSDIDAFDQPVAERSGLSRTDFRCRDPVLELTTAGTAVTPRWLAEAADLTPSTITSVLDGLEWAGLVRRIRQQADRRRGRDADRVLLLRPRPAGEAGPADPRAGRAARCRRPGNAPFRHSLAAAGTSASAAFGGKPDDRRTADK